MGVSVYASMTVVASLAAAGLFTLARYRSLLRLLIGFELLAAAAASSLVLVAGSLGFYATVVILDTLAAALFAAASYRAAKDKEVSDVDQL